MRYIKIASFWIFSLALAYLATLPYMNSFAIGGDDACKHAPNIMALADEIKAGRFPFGVMSSSRMGNGLITPLLYPCMFSSIASWLIAFGVNSVLATKIFIFLLNFATILITFWSARKITKSTGASWVIAILYTFAVYRIGDIYFRFALGEFVVMTFLPLVLYSIYNIFYEEKIKIWLFPLAFFCVVNSHLITTTFVFMFFMVLLLANIHKIVWIKERKFFINKKIFFDLLKIAGLTILLSIGFLLPMLEQRYGRLVLPGPWNMIDNHYDLKRVFSNDLSRSIGTWGIGIAFGLLSLVIIPWKKVKNKHFFATCIIIAAASFLMTTKYVPWSQLDKDFFNMLFSYIQFPWRFHTIFILFASFICGIALKNTLDYIKWNNVKAVLYGIIIAALVVNAHSFISKIDVRKHFYEEGMWKYEDVVAGNEDYFHMPDTDYLPWGFAVWPTEKLWTTAKNHTTGDEYIIENIKTVKTANVQAGLIEMPLAHYKGYSVKLQTEAGERIKLSYDISAGKRMMLEVPEAGKISVKYIGTPLFWISKIITYGTLIWLVIPCLTRNLKRRRNENFI